MAGMAGARLAPAAWVGMMAMAAFRSPAYCAVKVPAAVAVPSMTKTGVNGFGMGKGDVRARTLATDLRGPWEATRPMILAPPKYAS